MLRRLAKFLLWLGGWTAVGKAPDLRKAVFIAAPHTSNWDGFWAIVYITYIGLDAHWFIKKSMFWFPLNRLLTFFGAVPLNRERGGSAVSEAITAFDENEEFFLGLAPEGTRRKMKGWKSGFYRIADGANVPIVLGFLDFGSRRLGLGPVVTLTGNRDADMAILASFYSSVSGRWPEKTGPVRLAR